jgi:hypothetical protein
MFYVRKLNKEEINLIDKTYNETKEYFNKNKKEEEELDIKWVNIYLNQEIKIKHESYKEFYNYITTLVNENYQDWEKKFIISYGFIKNPAGNKKYQKFHVDFTTTSSLLFIPLTKVTLKNSPQYIKQKIKNYEMDSGGFWCENPEELMEKEGLEYLEV